MIRNPFSRKKEPQPTLAKISEEATHSDLQRVLAKGSLTVFWSLIRKYIEAATHVDNILAVKKEMGMKGFWYMKGYIQGQRDVVKMVNKAYSTAERDNRKDNK